MKTHDTLGSINGKITKCDTDNVKVIYERAYDSKSDVKKVSINADNVDLAKEATLSSIDGKVATESTLSNLNGKITKCDTDNVKVVSEKAYDNANDLKKVRIDVDNVGLAKDNTLSSIFSNKAVYDSFSNPSDYPSLVLDTEGRVYVEVWAKSISGGKTVKIYGSRDNTNWREFKDLEFVTDSSTYEGTKGFFNGYRYIKVEVQETGTGTIEIEISANR